MPKVLITPSVFARTYVLDLIYGIMGFFYELVKDTFNAATG